MHSEDTLHQGLAIIFALLTAISNAMALTAQHIASTKKPNHASLWRLSIYLVRQPLWLFGWIALVGSLIFQSLALHFGPLAEVQPLLVMELIVALTLRRFWLGQRINARAWASAGVTVVGLATFLVASAPRGFNDVPSLNKWVVSAVLCLGATALLSIFARRGSPGRRASAFGAATGVTWALEATYIKATTDTLSSSGYQGVFLHWPIYALVVGGIVGLFCEQAALHVGPLSVSQPFIVIVDPVVGVALGLWLYGETLRNSVGALSLATLGFLIMCAGVIVLIRHAPASFQAEIHRL